MVVFRSDPCGFLCILLTYTAVIYADYAVICWMIIPTFSTSLWGALHVLLYNVIVFLLLMSHARAVFSDPGMVSLPQNNLDFSDMYANKSKSALLDNKEEWSVCSRCETYRPPRAHHCRTCQRCIKRMDHHCPWINNCVGELNQKYFIQFLFYVGLASLYSAAMVVSSWFAECESCHEMIFKQHKVLHSVILLIESFLFGIFVIAILCDQFQAILSDETSIEQLQKKGPHRPRKPKLALMGEICGRGPPIMWLLPCHSINQSSENKSTYDV